MEKSLAYKFSQFSGLCPDTLSNPLEDLEPEILNDELQIVLNEIFAVDPITGVPKGDIAYYLSADGNPQVKDWIMNNLLQPRAAQTGSSIDGLTDDLIAEFGRQSGEDFESYAARLDGIRAEAQKNIDDFKSQKHEE